MNKKLAGTILRITVSAVLLGILAWRMPWNQVGDAFRHLRLDLWLLALGIYVFAQLVSSLRWQMLARPLGFERPLGHYFSFYFIGMFFNLLLPTSVGGDVVRAWYLDGGSGARLHALLSVFLDRFSGVLVLLGLACGATFFCPANVPAWIPWSVWATAFAAGGGVAFLAIVGEWNRRSTSAAGGRLVASFRGVARDVAQAIHLYRQQPRLLVVSTLLSLVIQAANIIAVWVIGLAIDAQVPATYYWVVVPMVTLLTLLPVSLNGMGIREGGMVLMLLPLGVGAGTATSLAFLWFATLAIASLAGVGFYLFGRFPRFEVRTDDGSVGDHSHQGREGQSPTLIRTLIAGAEPVAPGLRGDLR